MCREKFQNHLVYREPIKVEIHLLRTEPTAVGFRCLKEWETRNLKLVSEGVIVRFCSRIKKIQLRTNNFFVLYE